MTGLSQGLPWLGCGLSPQGPPHASARWWDFKRRTWWREVVRSWGHCSGTGATWFWSVGEEQAWPLPGASGFLSHL